MSNAIGRNMIKFDKITVARLDSPLTTEQEKELAASLSQAVREAGQLMAAGMLAGMLAGSKSAFDGLHHPQPPKVVEPPAIEPPTIDADYTVT